MSNCSKCGKEVIGDSSFCGHCGNKIADSPTAHPSSPSAAGLYCGRTRVYGSLRSQVYCAIPREGDTFHPDLKAVPACRRSSARGHRSEAYQGAFSIAALLHSTD